MKRKERIVCVMLFVTLVTVFLYCKVLRFDFSWKDEIRFACEKYGVEQKYIYAIIKAESDFRTDAVSSKGAIGLMQVLPHTAAEVGAKLNLPAFDLFCAKDNIEIGTYYFKYLLEKFSNVQHAVLAYNAGEGNVSAWLKDQAYSDDGVTLKHVPFGESADYLQRVMFYARVARLYRLDSPSVKQGFRRSKQQKEAFYGRRMTVFCFSEGRVLNLSEPM